MAANQLWVADITYIMLNNGDVCYLHLITDAYSRMIVGWELADTLRAAIIIKALEQAISQAGGVSLEGLIHHSDRGVQYCCDDYVGTLKEHKIKISMTEDYNPTDNAIAERANGIIKTETVYSRKTFNGLEHARNVIGRFIHFYNYRRPHMSIGYFKFEAYKSRKTNSFFGEMDYSFSEEHISLVSKRAVRFFTDSYK